MGRKARMYHKLSGSGFSLILTRSLWQGPDHLLWVEGSIAQERYKRFYFKDIQAMILRPNQRRLLWAIPLVLLVLLFLGIAAFSRGPSYVSTSMAVLGVGCLLVHWLQGPGCDVFLQTAVQREKLTTLARVNKALKVLDRIKALAEAAQGPLEAQSIAAMRASGDLRRSTAVSGHGLQAGDATPKPEQATGIYKPGLHWVLFGAVSIFGIFRCFQIWYRAIPLAAVDMFGMAFSLVLAIIAMARWHAQVKGTLVSVAGWMVLGHAVIHGLAVYVIFIAASAKNPGMAYNNWAILRRFFEVYQGSRPIIETLIIGIAVSSLGLGLFGVLSILNYGGGGSKGRLPVPADSRHPSEDGI
jgi:hypothetical protein